MTAYYNEFDPYAAQWLRNLINAGHIANGEVDERSITEVKPDDLKGFTQCHFFAGIGGWSLAARLAGWPDDRPLWTGSAPCQPFSTAGNQKGQDDERHLWPKFFELIRDCKPTTIMGEQVSAAIRFGWLDGVSSDLESEGYTCGSVIIPACAVNAPHKRDRLWFVADYNGNQQGEVRGNTTEMCELQGGEWPEVSPVIPLRGGETWNDNVGYTKHDGQPTSPLRGSDAETIQHYSQGQNCTEQFTGASASGNVSSSVMADTECEQSQRRLHKHRLDSQKEGERETAELTGLRSDAWHGAEYITGPDGKARRIEPSIPLLVDGIPARMAGCSALSDSKRRKGVLSGFGNAIVPQVAAEVIKAYMETRP